MSQSLSINVTSKKYTDPPVVLALEDVQLEVKAGEFVTILGPSGSGKSTLLRLVSGLDSDFAGSIKIGDNKVVEPSTNCGIVFQEPRLFPWFTVRQNLEYIIPSDTQNPAEYTKRVDELLDLMDLEEFADSYPVQLSGGMAQRVGLARALVTLPQVLLLDEPFAALDELKRMRLQDELLSVLQKVKATSLLVTHNIEEAVYLSDRIFVMSKRPGKLLKEYVVDMPKPRKRSSSEFVSLRNKILSEMRDELKLF